MHLLAREEIGLRCLLRVASRHGHGPVSISAVAGAEGLSNEYAAKILRCLRLGGLLSSTRGASGGYRLARPPEAITVWQAIRILDRDSLPESYCDCSPGERSDCARTTGCAIQSLWRRVGESLRVTLEGITLASLLDEVAEGVEQELEQETSLLVVDRAATRPIVNG
ncbi:MAG: Rrf2 family transcriptional regulator [Deltaproteobacteria bacterium]|nr:Rrf2 family transcriptional regulator [Deltaproteobacteria bacterium]MBW2421336.1 Rrf2 family transcriptional regulator [Deltaproteobacteria bacterium]